MSFSQDLSTVEGYPDLACKLLRYVRENPGPHNPENIEIAGYSGFEVQAHLKLLAKKGYLEEPGGDTSFGMPALIQETEEVYKGIEEYCNRGILSGLSRRLKAYRGLGFKDVLWGALVVWGLFILYMLFHFMTNPL